MILLCKEYTKVWLHPNMEDKQFAGILTTGDVIYTIFLAGHVDGLCLFYCLTKFGAGFIYVNEGSDEDAFFKKI